MTLIGIIISQKAILLRHKLGACTVCFMIFGSIGAVFFFSVEGPIHQRTQRSVLEARDRIVKKYENVNVEALNAFIDELRDLGIHGMPGKNGTLVEWRFSDSIFFVTTLVTTVGYGHFSPKTDIGRLFCIIYTAVGIPLTLIYLASYVDVMMKFSENYKAFLFRRYNRKLRPFYIRLLHVSSLMSAIVIVCFILPAFVFVCYEKNWTLFHGIYFCFISLTTVGLGDMVPGLDPESVTTDLYKICASLYLIVGVTIIMFMMAMCGDFHRNYRNDYEILPFTISTEKILINPECVHGYGSIIPQDEKSDKH